MGVHLAPDTRVACCVPAPVRASCPCRIPKLSREPGCRLSLVLCSDPGRPRSALGALLAHCLPCWACEHRIHMPPPGCGPPHSCSRPGVPPGPADLTQLGAVEPLFEVQPRPMSLTSSGVLWAAPLRAPQSLQVGHASPGSSGCLWSQLRSVCPATAAVEARVQRGAPRNTHSATVAAQTPHNALIPAHPRLQLLTPLGTRTSASDWVLTGTHGPWHVGRPG